MHGSSTTHHDGCVTSEFDELSTNFGVANGTGGSFVVSGGTTGGPTGPTGPAGTDDTITMEPALHPDGAGPARSDA